MYIAYSKKFRSVLVPIGKSASTSLMTWIYQLEDVEFDPHEGPRGKCNLTISLDEFKNHFNDFFIFTCVRNPFSRLVSCYLDKFVFDLFENGARKNRINISVEAFELSHNRFESLERFAVDTMGSDYDAGISFETFLRAIKTNYVEGVEMPQVDGHWASQYAIGQFEKITYNSVCRFESLSADIELIRRSLAIPPAKEFRIFKNVQRDREIEKNNSYFGNIPAAELSNISSCKKAAVKNFFTAETVDLVMNKFEEDMDYFGYNHLGYL